MFTSHAKKRSQQRSISPAIVNILLDFGNCGRHAGADVYYMDKETRKDANQYLGNEYFKQISSKLNSYVVMSDCGQVLTTCKRLKRLKF